MTIVKGRRNAMDTNQQQTLASIIRTPSQNQGHLEDLSKDVVFNNYLTVYAVNLVHRFPDVSDLNRIDMTTIRSIAEFCYAASTIAVNVWEETRERVGVPRQSRAA